MHIKTPAALTSAYLSARSQPSVRVGYVTTLSLIALYCLFIASNSFFIYQHHTENKITHAAEWLFPYPVATVNSTTLSLQRFRLEVSARDHYAATHSINASHQETQQFVLNKMITTELYEQTLKEHGIVVLDVDVNNKLKEIYTEIGGEDKLASFLKENYGENISVTHFKQWIRESLEESAVQHQLLRMAKVRHILIALPENPTDAQVADAKKRIEEAKAKITQPSEFGPMALQYSEDINSRDKEGSLGRTLRGDDAPIFSQEFEDAIFNLPISTVSDPIRSKYGWHIVTVDERTGSIDQSPKMFIEQLKKEASIRTLIQI